MAWFKVDDRLHGHPKVYDAGLEAIGLWAVAGAYTADYKLNGFIPPHYVAVWPRGRTLAGRLVTAGLWHTNVPGLDCDCLPAGVDLNTPGWRMHDYLDYNPTGAEVERERALGRERQRRYRERRTLRVNGEPH